MVKQRILIGATSALVAAFIFSPVTYAADNPQTVNSDMGKLSAKGSQAFQEVELARLAIFNGHTGEATKLVKQAQQSLEVADKDKTQFMKAESDLSPPSSMPPPAAASAASQVAASKTPVSWLPVGADVTVVDDFAHSPVKSKAVASANEHLRKGQPGEAIDTLKVADVNVAYTMALVPMKQTMTDVDKASDLLAQGKYYQADQILKRVVDGVRYDQVDITAVPAASSQKNAQKRCRDERSVNSRPVSRIDRQRYGYRPLPTISSPRRCRLFARLRPWSGEPGRAATRGKYRVRQRALRFLQGSLT
jgi:YfdX protein